MTELFQYESEVLSFRWMIGVEFVDIFKVWWKWPAYQLTGLTFYRPFRPRNNLPRLREIFGKIRARGGFDQKYREQSHDENIMGSWDFPKYEGQVWQYCFPSIEQYYSLDVIPSHCDRYGRCLLSSINSMSHLKIQNWVLNWMGLLNQKVWCKVSEDDVLVKTRLNRGQFYRCCKRTSLGVRKTHPRPSVDSNI